MQEKLTKIDNNTAEIIFTETVVTKEIVNITDLIYERDSLIRTKNMESDEFNARMAKIDVLISDLNAQIKKLTDIGLRTEVISPEIPVVENITPEPVVEPTPEPTPEPIPTE